MVSDNQNFIYAYDDDRHQIIIIDAETGEKIGRRDNRVQPILHHLKSQQAFIKLRKFIVWCAYASNEDIKPVQKNFFEVAEQAIMGKVERQTLQTLYSQSESEAIAVDTVGLRQGSTKAPGFLASRECVNPDAFEGAKNAARFHMLWVDINHKNEEQLPEGLQKVKTSSAKSVLADAEQAQIDYLLELIGKG